MSVDPQRTVPSGQSDPDRTRLAERQAELVRALLADGPAPAGFAPDRLRAEAELLRRKRSRVTALLRPDLADYLGERYGGLFDTYARTHPRPVGLRARADADAFADWLTDRGELPRRRWFRRRRAD